MHEQQIEKIEKTLEAIQVRNKRVETDKAWETSWFRKTAIAIMTYAVVVIFMYGAGIENPFVNAIVPTVGFILSTLTLSLVKKSWIKYFLK